MGGLLPIATAEKDGLMSAGSPNRLGRYWYGPTNVYKLENGFLGLVGGHSDRNNYASLYLFDRGYIYRIYRNNNDGISFKKDSSGNIYASNNGGGFYFYVISFNGSGVSAYSGDISSLETINIL